jgi:hypothetical protein
MKVKPGLSTGLLVSLGAIFSGLGTGAFIVLSLTGNPHVFWMLVAAILSTLGYWFLSRAYFILEDRLNRARAEIELEVDSPYDGTRQILWEES